MLLHELAAIEKFSDLKAALGLADEIWAAYQDDDRVRERLELGRLVSELKDEATRALVDVERLRELWSHFSTKPLDEERLCAPNAKAQLDDERKIADIRKKGVSPLARRWASLMLLVRLLQLRHNARKLADDLPLAIKKALEEELQERDVYLVLFPVSHSPIDLLNAATTEGGWGLTLKRGFSGKGTPNSPLRLDLEHVLEGKPWKQEDESYGLRAGERELLQWYGLSLVPRFSRVIGGLDPAVMLKAAVFFWGGFSMITPVSSVLKRELKLEDLLVQVSEGHPASESELAVLRREIQELRLESCVRSSEFESAEARIRFGSLPSFAEKAGMRRRRFEEWLEVRLRPRYREEPDEKDRRQVHPNQWKSLRWAGSLPRAGIGISRMRRAPDWRFSVRRRRPVCLECSITQDTGWERLWRRTPVYSGRLASRYVESASEVDNSRY